MSTVITDTMPRLGYAYVPVQKLDEVYPFEEGLERGTLFPELDLPLGVYEGGTMHE